MVPKQSMHTLGRQKPIAFRRHFMIDCDPGTFMFLVGRSVLIDNDFFIVGLEKAFHDARTTRTIKVKPVTRENSTIPVDFRIFRMAIVLVAKSKFLRKRHMVCSAVRTNAKQRNTTFNTTIRRILFHGADVMTNRLLAMPAVQQLRVQTIWKILTHF